MAMKKKKLNPILFVFLLTALAASACAGGSATTTDTAPPVSTETAQPDTPAPEPTATIMPCDVPLPGPADWPVAICESFNDNTFGWQVEVQDNEYARYESRIADGEFGVEYYTKGFGGFQKTAVTWFDVATAKDFALSVDGRINSDFERVSWGVAFRAEAEWESLFLLSLNNDGTYAFEIFENGAWISLISRRPFEGTPLGESNTLGIVAEGGTFNFTINGNPLNSFSGGLLEGLEIMLVVSADEGASVNFSFDNLVLQTG
jgi:hypothetical protein